MNLLGKRYADPEKILASSPGPSPWYLRAYPPAVPAGYEWLLKDVAGIDQGNIYLANPRGALVLGIGMYCYLMSLQDERLVMWYQRPQNGPVNFEILDLASLDDLGDAEDIAKRMETDTLKVFRKGGLLALYKTPAFLPRDAFHADIPDGFSDIAELLVLVDANFEYDENGDDPVSGRAIMSVRPREKEITVTPLDWFNNGPFDFGYEWITRVSRDPESGKVYGEGFRIDRFVLSDDLREVEHWFRSK